MLGEDDFLRVQEMYDITSTRASLSITTNPSSEFENARLELYWRPFDSRARVLYVSDEPRGRQQYYCMPLTALKLMRSESCLHLCRWNSDEGKETLWANLRFTIYEREDPGFPIVIFLC